LDIWSTDGYAEKLFLESPMLARCLVTGLLVASLAPFAGAIDVLNPDNGHYYRTDSPQAVPWEYAKLFAFQQMRDGMRGHLVTITSPVEQQFVKDNFLSFGGSGIWTGGIQPSGSPEPAGNWQWVTGEPFEYANWYPGGSEPNDAFDAEFVIEVFPDGYWNDTHIGGIPPYYPMLLQKRWIVEFTPGYMPSLDGADFLNWQRSFGKNGKLLGDFSGNWMTNADDLVLWKSYFGGGVPSPTPVPEASAAWLAILGVLGLGTVRRSVR
jgi:hypothetical protein